MTTAPKFIRIAAGLYRAQTEVGTFYIEQKGRTWHIDLDRHYYRQATSFAAAKRQAANMLANFSQEG